MKALISRSIEPNSRSRKPGALVQRLDVEPLDLEQQVRQAPADLAAVLGRHRPQHAVGEVGDRALHVGAVLQDRRRIADVGVLLDRGDAVAVRLGGGDLAGRRIEGKLADGEFKALRARYGQIGRGGHCCSPMGSATCGCHRDRSLPNPRAFFEKVESGIERTRWRGIGVSV